MELEPGDNYLWACVTMKEGATLDGRVVVRPASVVAGNKPVRVANAAPVAQRIGVAVVRHGDFKSNSTVFPVWPVPGREPCWPCTISGTTIPETFRPTLMWA